MPARNSHSSPSLPVSVPDGQPAPTGVRADQVVVVVSGSLGLATVPGVRERLLRVSHGPGIRLVLDLSGVTSCDILGLGLIIATARRARSSGGSLRLVAPSPAVAEALGASGLIRLLQVSPALDTQARTSATEATSPDVREAA
ncbi:STAS domain-containing protein [Streptomyces mauvecolor]|uniref:Anti-sigma factor antagonist n=1 Tax=Streptomyces mauvecolor TaxID=58345 RepID=A0ABV9V097_9ACTN